MSWIRRAMVVQRHTIEAENNRISNASYTNYCSGYLSANRLISNVPYIAFSLFNPLWF